MRARSRPRLKNTWLLEAGMEEANLMRCVREPATPGISPFLVPSGTYRTLMEELRNTELSLRMHKWGAKMMTAPPTD